MNVWGSISRIPNIPSVAQSIVSNFNPQQITNSVNQLWNLSSGITAATNQVVRGFTGGLTGGLTDNVILLVDISAESRLYLQNDCHRELDEIIGKSSCKVSLNLPPSMADGSPVSITGSPDKVRECYLELRQLTPITVALELSEPNAQPLEQILKDIQSNYELKVFLGQMPRDYVQTTPSNQISISFQTNRGKEDNLLRGLTKFIESKNVGNFYQKLKTIIDIPQRMDNIFRTPFLNVVMEQTSTEIIVKRENSHSLLIVGSDFPSISSARTEISDKFMVELNFDVNIVQSHVLENFGRELERLGEVYGVHILMKPSANVNYRTMIIRGSDKEVNQIFNARNEIIEIMTNPIQNSGHI